MYVNWEYFNRAGMFYKCSRKADYDNRQLNLLSQQTVSANLQVHIETSH